ncbi:hypothetical protein PMIN02_003343 [Paraphaeosphaeria minitans]
MRAATSRCVLANDLLRRRRRHLQPRTSLHHLPPTYSSNAQRVGEVVNVKLSNMAGSLARKERRRKEREGMQSPVASKTAYVESVDDEGEPRGGAVQKTEDKPADSVEDISTVVPVSETPKGSQPRPQRSVRPPPTSPVKRTRDRDQTNQKQSKDRSKRGPPPRVPRESEPPFGSLGNGPSSAYGEAIKTLQSMSPDESAHMRNVIISQMAAKGYPIATESLRSAEIKGRKYPMRSTVNPPWAPSARKKDVMTEEEAENLRRAMLDKMNQSTDQDWIASMARSLEESRSENSPTPHPIIGNVDGASQSVEVVTPEKGAPSGEQATIVQPKKREDIETVNSLLATDIESELGDLPRDEHLVELSKMVDQTAFDEGILNTDPEKIKDAIDVLTQGNTAEAAKALDTIPPVADQDSHTKRVARIDGMAKKLRESVEQARTEIRPAQEGVALDRGFAQHSSTSDYASSSGDSVSKPHVSRTRRITNDGILELKASPFKVGPARVPSKEHRRKVSLKLPINVATPQRAYARPSTQPTQSAYASTEDSAVALYEAEERELEYKHRHIFIGTASLDDFLEILEVTPTYTTSKRQAVKAFGILACAEQVHARQSSNSSDDYLTEAHVKLGSISLGKFLGKIPFDDKGDVAAMKVVEAFCLASHLDGEATYGAQFKAKAFRSWFVREKAARQYP